MELKLSSACGTYMHVCTAQQVISCASKMYTSCFEAIHYNTHIPHINVNIIILKPESVYIYYETDECENGPRGNLMH